MAPFGLTFTLPWVLLALPALLLLPRSRVWGWRLVALALLLVALAQPRLSRPSTDLAVLIDVSDSLGGAALEAFGDFRLEQLANPPEIFMFAGDATHLDGGEKTVPEFLDTSSSDLARALQVAAASGARRALLLSDGQQSRGDALVALPPLPVDVLPVPPQANARLVGLLAPDQASPGETVEVVAAIESDRATTITLTPDVGGEPLQPIELEIPAGKTSVPFTFQVAEGATVRVTASLAVDFEQPTSDDGLALEIAVSEREPVLVLGDPALARLLAVQGFDVIEGDVADVATPLDYSAVVLRASAGRFTPGQLDLLQGYVENGGGLMMTGGPDSFGLGGWYRTPIEQVLPVNTDLRTEVALPLVALVIVLDRSQSMSTGNPSKIDLAKEGAISVVDLAYQEDLLGLIAFSDESSTEWVFPLRQATERGKREMLNAILNITTQGGTVLEPAYRLALSTLAQTEAAVKHVIILSDGKLYDGQGPFAGGRQIDFVALAAQGLAGRITTSTIAIGDSADFDRLRSIATAGGGRYYEALDVNTLPQIFTSEALTATRSLLREDPFQPIPHRHPLVDIRGSVPGVDAYIASSLKADAEMLLEGLQEEPLLAVHRLGLGRTAALTTDLNLWAGPLGSWSELPALLGTVVRWLQAKPADYSAAVSREGTQYRVVVDAVQDGVYLNNKNLEVRHGGLQVPMEQVAPGRYEARLEATGTGGTLLVVDGSDIVARSRITAPHPEFEPEGARILLEQIAGRTGGILVADPETYLPASRASSVPVWPAFAVAAFVAFLAELLIRRFGRERGASLASD